MRSQTNELLLYARLPFHYWTETRGGRWPFDNPGCSVMSLCASKLNMHIVTVPPEVQESLAECREFTTDVNAIMAIMHWIDDRAQDLVTKANGLRNSSAVVHELTTLVGNLNNMRAMLAVLIGSNPPEKLDLEQELSIMFLQSMIDIKVDIENLEAAIIRVSKPEKA